MVRGTRCAESRSVMVLLLITVMVLLLLLLLITPWLLGCRCFGCVNV